MYTPEICLALKKYVFSNLTGRISYVPTLFFLLGWQGKTKI
jgi:hypothetical protein